MTKSSGSNNSKNLAKAVLDGLTQLQSKETFATLRGVEIADTEVDVRVERGSAFMPATPADGDKMRGPVNRVGEDSRGGGRGGRRGAGGGGRGGGGRSGGGRGRDDASSSGSSEPAAS
jgi:uncharacterized membrane protein YgcG